MTFDEFCVTSTYYKFEKKFGRFGVEEPSGLFSYGRKKDGEGYEFPESTSEEEIVNLALACLEENTDKPIFDVVKDNKIVYEDGVDY